VLLLQEVGHAEWPEIAPDRGDCEGRLPKTGKHWL